MKKYTKIVKNKYYKQIYFMKEVIHLLGKKEVSILPSYIAFFLLLSFFPILSLIFEVIFLIVNNNQEFLNTLKEILPSHVFTLINVLINHNTSHINILTFSNIVLLFLASRIYASFHRSYLIIYQIDAKPHFLKYRIIALINTILLIILIFALAILTVFNRYFYEILENTLKDFTYMSYVFNYSNLAFSITIISSIITFMMYSIPDIKQKVKDVFQGALFVTLGWIAVSYGFKIYSANFANYENVYRTFTAVVIFVTWIYLMSFVLIIGIIINKVRQKVTNN